MTVGHQSGLVERLILRSLPLCILLFLVSVDYARAVDPNQAANSYIRTRFADAEGLTSTLVDDIVQSQDGFLWLREYGTYLGHWGLRGMRERAGLVGGNLEVWSEVGSGTEVELTVPAASAYAKPASRWTVFSRSWRSKRP